jgi:hypothetical protein
MINNINETKINCEGKTVFDLLQEIANLKQEKEQLTLDRDFYKNGLEALHNYIDNQNNKSITNEGGWSDEEFNIAEDGYAKELENYSLR